MDTVKRHGDLAASRPQSLYETVHAPLDFSHGIEDDVLTKSAADELDTAGRSSTKLR